MVHHLAAPVENRTAQKTRSISLADNDPCFRSDCLSLWKAVAVTIYIAGALEKLWKVVRYSSEHVVQQTLVVQLCDIQISVANVTVAPENAISSYS